MTDLRILHQDRDFLVVDKPSGIATTSPTGRDCLVELVRAFDPRSPKMHPTSRLDAEVSGVLVFATSERGIAHALGARAAHAYRRLYVAIASRLPEPDEGRWDFPIGVDPKDARRRVVDTVSSSAKPSSTRYRVVGSATAYAFLALFPETGRTHQLRVHSAHAGAPLLGDVHYGGAKRVVAANGRVSAASRVMLHCARVALPELDGRALRFESPLPEDLILAARAAGIDPDEAMRRALAL